MTALIVIAAIILFFAFILFMPIVFYAEFEQELKLSVRYLFVKIRLVPRTPKEEKAEKKPKEPKEKKEDKEENKEKENKFSEIFKKTGVGGLLEIISDLAGIARDGAGKIIRRIVISKLVIEIRSGGEDAAAAAVNVGYISAALYPSVSVILNSVKKYKSARVQVFPDYDSGKTSAMCMARVKIKVWWVLSAAVSTAFKLLKKFLELKRKEII